MIKFSVKYKFDLLQFKESITAFRESKYWVFLNTDLYFPVCVFNFLVYIWGFNH